MFATHYHELTELAERLPGAQNYQITATEREGEVVFLHKLEAARPLNLTALSSASRRASRRSACARDAGAPRTL
jgi:hypothetical protein